MYDLWGIPACTKLQSSHLVDFIYEQDRERVRREYENCISERTSYRSEFRIQHKLVDSAGYYRLVAWY